MHEKQNINLLWPEYKTLIHGKLAHVIELNNRIKLFNLVYQDIRDLVDEICSEAPKHHNISTNEYYSLRLRQKVIEFFSAIQSNRDAYKDNIVCIDGDKRITNKLIDTYSSYQNEYDNLLLETIEQNNSFYLKFIRLIRNKLLHTNAQLIFRSFLYGFDEKYSGLIILDYDYIYTRFRNDNNAANTEKIKRYFIDEIQQRLTMWHAQGYCPEMDFETRKRIFMTIRSKLNQLGLTKTETNIELHKIITDTVTMKEYIDNIDFNLASYNAWKKQEAIRQEMFTGQFMFNLSKMIEEIFAIFNKYYISTYEILTNFHCNEIDRVYELEELILKSDYILPADLKHDRAKFILDIDYNSTKKVHNE